MRIYNHVRSRGKLNAVVPIENGNCSACRISLAPQVIVEATKAKALVACESCQRIIYRPEALAAKAA
jgi:predicted  nucleic acid-binding Zn-ribbon protein